MSWWRRYLLTVFQMHWPGRLIFTVIVATLSGFGMWFVWTFIQWPVPEMTILSFGWLATFGGLMILLAFWIYDQVQYWKNMRTRR